MTESIADLSGLRQMRAWLNVLDSACDGARTDDRVGFSATDSSRGKMLARIPESVWGRDEAEVARQLCIKYQGQLGIQTPEIQEAARFIPQHHSVDFEMRAEEIREEIRAARFRSGCRLYVDAEAGRVRFVFPYNESLITRMRALGGFRFDRATKSWVGAFTESVKAKLFAFEEEFHASPDWDEIRGLRPSAAVIDNGRSVRMDGPNAIFAFPFIPEIKDALKRLGGRFSPNPPLWTVTLTKSNAREVAEIAEKSEFKGFEAVRDYTPPALARVTLTDDLRPTFRIFRSTSASYHLNQDLGPFNQVWEGDSGRFSVVPVTTLEALEELKTIFRRHELEIEFDEAACRQKVEEIAAKEAGLLAASKALDAEGVEVEGLGGTLRPFQRAAVAYARDIPRAIIGDEMGLGKTVEALAILQDQGAFPALILCPASLRQNWLREAGKWLPFRSISTNERLKPDLLVMSYDTFRTRAGLIQAQNSFKGLVCDESHFLKNPKAKRTKVVLNLVQAQEIPVRLLMTGTAIINRVNELATQLEVTGGIQHFGGRHRFVRRFAEAEVSRGQWNRAKMVPLIDELHKELRRIGYIRRRKEEVLSELPPKQRVIVELPLSNRQEYEEAEKNLARYLWASVYSRTMNDREIEFLPDDMRKVMAEAKAREAVGGTESSAEHLVRINTLRQVAARGKMEAFKEWASSFVDGGEKLVVFAHHIAIQKAAAEALPGSLWTREPGGLGTDACVRRFQDDPEVPAIVLSLKGDGTGHTLTAASNVAMLEQGWTAAEHDQAEDRCHRIGQKGSVTAWYVLAPDTIDMDIYELTEAKREIVNRTLDGRAADGVQTSILSDLFERVRNGHASIAEEIGAIVNHAKARAQAEEEAEIEDHARISA